LGTPLLEGEGKGVREHKLPAFFHAKFMHGFAYAIAQAANPVAGNKIVANNSPF
jgi:hypothetical protein